MVSGTGHCVSPSGAHWQAEGTVDAVLWAGSGFLARFVLPCPVCRCLIWGGGGVQKIIVKWPPFLSHLFGERVGYFISDLIVC